MSEKTKWMEAEEKGILLFKILLANKFLLLFFSHLSSHYMLTYKYVKEGTILDAGCGMGFPVMCFKALGVKSKFVGLDPWCEYLQTVKKRGLYDELVLGSVVNPPFKDRSFDTAIFLQVLEHLTRKDGLVALKELMEIAENVVLTTPVGFLSREVDPGISFQTHKSGWYPEELIRLGFRVRGYGWLKLAQPKRVSPKFVYCLIALNMIFEPLLRFFPKLAFFMHARASARFLTPEASSAQIL